MSAVGAALARLRARRRRVALTALGIFASGLMVGAAATLALDLHHGFERAAALSDLPDVIVHADPTARSDLGRRVQALPGIEASALRYEAERVPLAAPGHRTPDGLVEVVDPGRRGYAIVAGHDVAGSAGGVVLERGVARAWGLSVGDALRVGRLGTLRVAGIGLSPDNVAYPLASTARVYVSSALIRRRLGPGLPANVALLWLAHGASVDASLTQARATSFGLRGVSFLTRGGVRIAIDEAAGVVIALLVAFAVVTLAISGVVLAAGAQAEVRRRATAIGTVRALGASRARVAAEHALDGAVLGLTAGGAGIALGAWLVSGRSENLLEQLNLTPVGRDLIVELAGLAVALTALLAAASAWPAWRITAVPVARTMRGGDLVATPRGRRGRPDRRQGFVALGARMAIARRARFAGTVVVLAAATGAIALLLSLAQALRALRDDPGSIGRFYQLTASLPPEEASAVRALPGVADAAPRYSVDAADSFQLGERLRVIAYPGSHTAFEAPPLASGRRVRHPDEAEVGTGLADALGLSVGSVLAVQLPSGGEARFRVVGTIRALELEGRVAYTQPSRLLAADPGLRSRIAVRLRHRSDLARVSAGLQGLGAQPGRVGAASTHNKAFLGVLASLLQALAAIVALASLQALLQSLALIARERRGALAMLRTLGAGRVALGAVLAAGGLAAALPAVALGLAADALALGPWAAHAAAPYAVLDLEPSAAIAAGVGAGLLALALLSAGLAVRAAERSPIVGGLRQE